MHPWLTEAEPTTNFFMETPTNLEKCYMVTRLSQTLVLLLIIFIAARVDAGSVASVSAIGHVTS